MSYNAIVVQLTNVREHPNADRLKLATVLGNQVIVSIDSKDGDVGVFFETDGVLSNKFMHVMNLHRHAHLNKDQDKAGMFEDNGRVRAQTFRGERSEGFWIDMDSVGRGFTHEEMIPVLHLAYEFTHIGKMEICAKYINPATLKKQNQQKSSKKITNQMFHQHFNTAQFRRNQYLIGPDEKIIVTEKLHGTSQRVANVFVEGSEPLTLWEKICGLLCDGFWITHVGSWKDMVGTRRVILDNQKLKEDSGFHPVSFRELAAKPFMGNMKKGETFYYEVVGYEGNERPIMGTHNNTKLRDHLSKEDYKRFIEQFGDTTIFNYGRPEGSLDIYVYRITLTNEDGYSVDLSWDAVKQRCSELGVKHVPEIVSLTREEMAQLWANINEEADGRKTFTEEEIQELSCKYIEYLSEGNSVVGPHLSEGICLRVERGITPLVLKEKNFHFKVLEGIIKSQEDYVDAEEVEA